MFKKIRQRLEDMKTIRLLCEAAERFALQDQQDKPRAEHFLLATFELPDGTARSAFEKLGVSFDAVKQAIDTQYRLSLEKVGIEVPPVPNDAAVKPQAALYRASASGEAFMKALAAQQKKDGHPKLLGAHALMVLADMQAGSLARVFKLLELDAEAIKRAAYSASAGGA